MEEKFSFEENMAELNKIVAELEKGDIPLEKAVELYGRGVELSAVCKKQLSEAKIKITEVDGNIPSEK
ncbi:MAG: exodeoxyribonuclease VII small subunit [Ruminococcus sp.]|jgi:exodeoxyribonuclease VII small subunit|nr:exodeoxyribonuclease VII small subunit [Ruminococcus sp.]MBQ4534497.1 exodeoxyribonuclease VII small subunit [Ruminococcus sp.]